MKHDNGPMNICLAWYCSDHKPHCSHKKFWRAYIHYLWLKFLYDILRFKDIELCVAYEENSHISPHPYNWGEIKYFLGQQGFKINGHLTCKVTMIIEPHKPIKLITIDAQLDE